MIEILQNRTWALETKFFNQMAPIVMHRLSMGKGIADLIDKPEPAAYGDDRDVYQVDTNMFFSRDEGYFFKTSEEDKIITATKIQGTITKNGGMCSDGTAMIKEKLLMKDASKNVSAHILLIDSPGGAVDGTPEIASVIKSLTKPVVAYVDHMAASAAYWIASQTSHIVANKNNYTEVGSIGTLAMMMNEREYLKKEGIKVQIMRADKSVDKARLNSIEKWPEASLEELQQDLNSINSDFINAVLVGRNGKLNTLTEDIFTGKMYDKKKALMLGMIDQIGTLQDAIRAAELISKNRFSPIFN
jgi:protease IV